MRHGSLFNGIGGFQLAAAWMGWENVMSCEIDEFCNKVTKHHFPNCIQHGDIKTTDFSIYRGKIDLVTGGFPCQPFSMAGKRKGTEDNRHLWPEMLRAIGEIQPRWVIGENVPGLINWSKGLVFEQVQADLEAEGFEVFPPCILPACATNAPHRRDRVWIVAHSISAGARCKSGKVNNKGGNSSEDWGKGIRQTYRQTCASRADSTSTNGNVTDTESGRLQGRGRTRLSIRPEAFRYEKYWQPISEPSIPRGTHGFPNRVDRTKALGNAIVPQVAFQIFKTIEQYENLKINQP